MLRYSNAMVRHGAQRPAIDAEGRTPPAHFSSLLAGSWLIFTEQVADRKPFDPIVLRLAINAL